MVVHEYPVEMRGDQRLFLWRLCASVQRERDACDSTLWQEAADRHELTRCIPVHVIRIQDYSIAK
jgi:hypothetical protein